MKKRYYANCAWQARAGGIDDCSSRTMQFFKNLPLVDPLLKTWKETARSEARALASPSIDFDDRNLIEKLLRKGQHRHALKRTVMPEYGFSLRFWNGLLDDQSGAVSIGCGASIGDQNYPNAVTITMPSSLEVFNSNLSKFLVIDLLVNCWDPDWALYYSSEDLAASMGNMPFLGRALYISNRFASKNSNRFYEFLERKKPEIIEGYGFYFVQGQ